MYAIVDQETKRLIGQTHSLTSGDSYILIPIDDKMYRHLFDNPMQYQEYLGVMTEDGKYELRFSPQKEFSECRAVQLFPVKKADIWIEVVGEEFTLRSEHGVEPLETSGFVHGDFSRPVFYGSIELGIKNKLSTYPDEPGPLKDVTFFVARPAIGYQYGVIYK